MAQPQAVGIGAGVVTSSPDDCATPPMYRRDRVRRWLPACSPPVDLVRAVPDPRWPGGNIRSTRTGHTDDF